jgi:hypothetical protein
LIHELKLSLGEIYKILLRLKKVLPKLTRISGMPTGLTTQRQSKN